MSFKAKEKISQISKRNDNKFIKEKNLYDAAYELFTTKGIYETSIDDIVKKAGVAKGTFYLYFMNKYDIIDKIILKKASGVIEKAVVITEEKNLDNYTDIVISVIDYIIEFFRENKKLLKLIHKNLSWGIYRKALANPEEFKIMEDIRNFFMTVVYDNEIAAEEFENNLFMIIELTGSVCYSSIILEEPANIDTMKPALFNMIKKMLTN